VSTVQEWLVPRGHHLLRYVAVTWRGWTDNKSIDERRWKCSSLLCMIQTL
jgi:hypothetical protein